MAKRVQITPRAKADAGLVKPVRGAKLAARAASRIGEVPDGDENPVPVSVSKPARPSMYKSPSAAATPKGKK